MSLPLSIELNLTQQVDVLNILHGYTVRDVVPTLLLETFVFGACTGCVLLGSYMLWTRIALALLLWSLYAALTTHWTLSLQYFWQTILGRAAGLPLTVAQVKEAVSLGPSEHASYRMNTFLAYGATWQSLIPSITETTLLGFSTVLLAVMVYVTIRQNHTLWRSPALFFVPFTAIVMYILSVSHWATSLALYGINAREAPNVSVLDLTDVVDDLVVSWLFLPAALTINIILSDAIVLWRMSIVWQKARFAIVLSCALVATTAVLSIANLAKLPTSLQIVDRGNVSQNSTDSELVTTFGGLTVGLAAVFMSLASNVCATALVGLKVWMHKSQLGTRSSLSGQTTLLERFMELIVHSGVIYTSIWILYVISFFKPISVAYTVLGVEGNPQYGNYSVTAVSHLDAAMAQLTTIYPLVIYILVAVNKESSERHPQAMRTDLNTFDPRTINFDTYAERGILLNTEAAGDAVRLEEVNKAEARLNVRGSW